MSRRTALGRVRGLGSAMSGTDHWWHQRVTAVALVPLVIWFVTSIVGLVGADYAVVVAWLRNPLVAIIMVLLLSATYYHLRLGLQVVIEDYVHDQALKVTARVGVDFFCIALAAACVFAVLKLAFGG